MNNYDNLAELDPARRAMIHRRGTVSSGASMVRHLRRMYDVEVEPMQPHMREVPPMPTQAGNPLLADQAAPEGQYAAPVTTELSSNLDADVIRRQVTNSYWEQQ